MTTLSRYLALLLLPAFLVLAACDSNDPDSSDTDGAGEEEVITTVNITFTPQGGGAAAEFTANFDEAGVLQNAETITLMSATTYDVSIELLNELETPAEDITEEVRDEEPGAHRFFYTPEGGVANRMTVSNLDTDPLGDPLGVTFDVAVSAGGAATGAFRAKLRHYEDGADLPADKRADTPTAPEVPDVVENDFDFTFPVEIQ
ncbi:MAG: type 1 periplasmic binding fold superfamily protein [Bacteroidota bacterium]